MVSLATVSPYLIFTIVCPVMPTFLVCSTFFVVRLIFKKSELASRWTFY